MDFRLRELAVESDTPLKPSVPESDLLHLYHAFSDFSACISDISGELQRLAFLPSPNHVCNADAVVDLEPESNRESLREPWLRFLQGENLSSEIVDNAPPEILKPAVKLCVEGLHSSSISIKRSAAAKLRLRAKNRSENRALVGQSGAISTLIPLLRCSDSWAQEQAITALFNLSLHEDNKTLITDAGAIKPLIYVLKTGTEVSKQNAACVLLSLALVDDNKIPIGACGAIPPLVSLLLDGSTRGKKDSLITLYKLCTVEFIIYLNKTRWEEKVYLLMAIEQDEKLDELSANVERIGGVGRTIHEELLGQGKTVEVGRAHLEMETSRFTILDAPIGHLQEGLNPPSANMLYFHGPYLGLAIKTGIITGILSLTEGIAVGRTFASLKNYQVDGNKKMMAIGMMNMAGSCSSCFVTSGSFSRSAVNYNAGAQSVVSNIVMAATVLVTLLFE